MKLTNIVKSLVIAGAVSSATPAVADSHFISETNAVNTSISFVNEFDVNEGRIAVGGNNWLGELRIINKDISTGVETPVITYPVGSRGSLEEIKASSKGTAWTLEFDDERDWDGDGNLDNTVNMYFNHASGTQLVSINEDIYEMKLLGDNLIFLAQNDNTHLLLRYTPQEGLSSLSTNRVHRNEFDGTKTGAYAFIEEPELGPDRLIFFNGTSTNVYEGSLDGPVKIRGGSAFFVDREKHALMNLNSLFTGVQLALRENEDVEELIISDTESYIFLRTFDGFGEDITQAFRMTGQNSLEYIATFDGDLEDAKANDTGLYFSVENRFEDETSVYHFERNKGLSLLFTEENVNGDITLADNQLVQMNGNTLERKVVDEIPLPTEYHPDLKLDLDYRELEDSQIKVTSPVMQGKRLVIQASPNLNEWYDVKSEISPVDGVREIREEFQDVWENMADVKYQQTPGSTSEEWEIFRQEFEDGPIFFRAQLRY